MNQREAFEAWAINHLGPEKNKDGSTNYTAMTMWAVVWDAWQAALASQWQPIETLPVKQMLESREMFVVRGFNVEGVATGPYTTDAYTVWLEYQDCGCCHRFVRWKHNFAPTHWMPLPPAP